MKKVFNIAGPCVPEEHYMLHFEKKIEEIKTLVEQKNYFVLHAARQSGKTTLLLELTKMLNAESEYYVLYCSLEGLQNISNRKEGIPAIVETIRNSLLNFSFPLAESFAQNANKNDFANVIKTELTTYCKQLDKPLVIFFDEADCLSDDTLITFLRQLRNGFNTRSLAPFVHSIALVGMRNIRDYKAKIRPDSQTLGSASPFNIVTESLTLSNFDMENIEQLYRQHTEVGGQEFTRAAIMRVYEKTDGQPWLVNAIARECVVKLLSKDSSQKITEEFIDMAIDNLIIRRDTHIDSLLERLKEERVRSIIEPMIIGKKNAINFTDDDTGYCLDLGLIKVVEGELLPANPIYNEVIIRTLTYNTQFHLIGQITKTWQNEDGFLQMDDLLQGFQEFWRENSAIWQEKYDYKEAAPHLILQAFLQRVVNGGGSIQREYAANRGRLDLCIFFKGKRYPLEIKLRYHSKTYQQGIEQLSQYMDTLGLSHGWLIVFDKRKSISWNKKLFMRKKKINSKEITIIGV